MSIDQTRRDRVIMEIRSERTRQVEVEGWSLAHDDNQDTEELAQAGAAYALFAAELSETAHSVWPLGWTAPKSTTARRDLVKAAALIIAEIERLDRKEDTTP